MCPTEPITFCSLRCFFYWIHLCNDGDRTGITGSHYGGIIRLLSCELLQEGQMLFFLLSDECHVQKIYFIAVIQGLMEDVIAQVN